MLAEGIEVSNAAVGVLSNRDGAVLTDGREILNRIVDQIANPVRWDLCMQTLLESGVTGAIEVAPAGTLVGLIKRAVPTIAQCALKSPAELESATSFIAEHGGK
jgi:[acyl-carrier-protein] S-malonyltransferase